MRTFKRLLTVFATCTIAFCLAFGLSACGGGSASPAEDAPSAEGTPTNTPSDEELVADAFDAYMDTFMNPTPEGLAEYLEGVDTSTYDENGIDFFEFVRNCFKRLDYTVSDIAVDGDNATLTVTVSNAKLNEVMDIAGTEFTEDPASFIGDLDINADDYTNQATQRFFAHYYELLDSTDLIFETEVEVNYSKIDGVWVIDPTSASDLDRAMLNGSSL